MERIFDRAIDHLLSIESLRKANSWLFGIAHVVGLSTHVNKFHLDKTRRDPTRGTLKITLPVPCMSECGILESRIKFLSGIEQLLTKVDNDELDGHMGQRSTAR